MRFMICGALAAALSMPLAAQFGGPPHGGGFGRGFGGALGHQHTVAGLPYSATVTNSVVEHLPDGNTIQRSETGQVARDSQGRTYEQQTVTGGPLAPGTSKTLIFLSDPVAGYSYVLNTASKTATRRPLHAHPANADQAAEGTAATPQVHANENAVTSDLGQDTTAGVVAKGTSTTYTIPAGKIGNAAAIVSSVQRWYSSELQLVVKSIRNDPRFGTSTYALSNVSRAEPDPALFQVPAGYTVKDASTHEFHRGGPAAQ